MRLTEAQREALRACLKYGRLWRSKSNYWNWLASDPNGYAFRIATNPTVYVLKSKNLLSADSETSVKITDLGRSALAQSEDASRKRGE